MTISRRAFLRALAATPLAAFVPLLSRVPAPVAPTVADWKRVSDKLPPLRPAWTDNSGHGHDASPPDTVARLELADGTVYVGGNFRGPGGWGYWENVGSVPPHIDTIA